MPKHVSRGAATSVAFIFGASTYIIWQNDLIQALEHLDGGPNIAYSGGLGGGMTVSALAHSMAFKE